MQKVCMEDVKDEFLEHLKDIVTRLNAMFLRDGLLEHEYTYYEVMLRCFLTCIRARRMRLRRGI